MLRDGKFRLASMKSLSVTVDEKTGFAKRSLDYIRLKLEPNLEVSGEPIDVASMHLVASQYLGPISYVSDDSILNQNSSTSINSWEIRRKHVRNCLDALIYQAMGAAREFGASHFALVLASQGQQVGVANLDATSSEMKKSYIEDYKKSWESQPKKQHEFILHPMAQLYVHKVA